MAKDQEIPGAEGAGKIDALKEIIFGQDIKAFQKEFDELRSMIEGNSDRLNAGLSEAVANLEKRLEKLESTLNDRVAKMEERNSKQFDKLAESKMDRAKLGKMLVQLGEKLSS